MTLRLVPPLPLKRAAIATRLGLSPTGGHSLGIVSDAIDDALKAFHRNAAAIYGEEHAAILLVGLLLLDASYKPREWVAAICKPHQAAIMGIHDSR